MRGVLPSAPIRCWPLDAARAMTDNCGDPRAGGHPLEIEQADEQPTLDGLRREIEELRASRERLALAADAERRGIERALHEGVQQDLVGLAANLQVAAASLDSDPAATKALLDELQRETRRAIDGDAGARQPDLPCAPRGGRAGRGAPRGGEPRRRAGEDRRRCARHRAAGARRRRLLLRARRVRARARRHADGGERPRRGRRARVRGRRGSATWDRSAAPRTIASRRWADASTITSEGDRTTVAGSLPLP